MAAYSKKMFDTIERNIEKNTPPITRIDTESTISSGF